MFNQADKVALAARSLRLSGFCIAGLVVTAIFGWNLLKPLPVQACAAGTVASSAARSFIAAAQAGSSGAFASALNRHVDMKRVVKFALGRHRRKVNNAELPAFNRAATRYVARVLAQFSGRFKAKSFEVGSCSASTVKGRLIRTDGGTQPVTWKIKGGRVEDVNVQNVWLGQALRSNFNSVIKNRGIGGLFKQVGVRRSDKNR